MTVMLVILWAFALFSYGRPVVVRCMGVRLGMGWVGSWVHKFTWQWVGLGWVDENRPTDNSASDFDKTVYC